VHEHPNTTEAVIHVYPQDPSDLTIRSLKPGCPGRLSDGSGLYLLTFLSEGRHHWRLDCSFEGKRRTLRLGVYPDTTWARAREVTQ
jgi:hypothetical protein